MHGAWLSTTRASIAEDRAVSGIDTALGEITLVLFTTLAPSGVMAFVFMGCPALFGMVDDATRHRIDKFLSIPLITSMVGLVASATHLGNPANALYVFLGVGRSPLSTEVFCAVVFLAFAGLYWLYTFAEHPRVKVQRVWMGFCVVAGIIFVTAVGFAYNAETIVSWYTVYVPLNLWLNALVGGPLLAVLSLRVAGYQPVEGRFGRVLVIVSGMALLANAIGFGLQGAELASLENSMVSGNELVPYYGFMVAAFCILGVLGVGMDAHALFGSVSLTFSRSLFACVLVLAGIFIMRFAFYMMHMTVGVGV